MTSLLQIGTASCRLHVRDGEGRISAFAAETPAEGKNLVAEAERQLRRSGCRSLLGPIGADTWDAYRLVVETDDTPVFPGEPRNPAFFVDCFTDNGFEPMAHYVSAIDTVPTRPTRQTPSDLVIGEWNPSNPEADLTALHAIANTAFAAAPYFAPIDLDRFAAIHAPLLASLPPRYCLVGRDAGSGAIVSSLLGYPSPAGLVLKSLMAIRPGAGSALVDAFYDRALDDGHAAIVHALMHEDNTSTRMSTRRNSRIFRRYALFGKKTL